VSRVATPDLVPLRLPPRETLAGSPSVTGKAVCDPPREVAAECQAARMPGEVIGGKSVEALSRLGYRPALDGVRAMAILAVLGYHGTANLKGGFIGVDIFFVLSGFLITTLLFQEWSHAHAIALGNFYGRRARRLLPALFLTVAGVGLIYAIDPSLNHGISFGRAALVVILYAGNWVAAFADNPVQVLALLDHTWSLAIEEQFYILWPLLLLICLRRRWRPRSVLVLALTLACASALLRWFLWQHGSSSHVYFRSDTHADGLLLGCALAAVYASRQGRELMRRYLGRWLVALAAAVGLLVVAFRYGPNDRFVYVGGLSAVAICTAVLVGHVVCAQDSWFSRTLALPPLVWIGSRSYGMYLFHIPIFAVIATTRLSDSSARLVIPLRIALTMLAAAASYKWVESYFLRRNRLKGAPPHVQRAPIDRQSESQQSPVSPGRPTTTVLSADRTNGKRSPF
jgi:peptidoglycan/LPS O-acetylase OafA/YrhL